MFESASMKASCVVVDTNVLGDRLNILGIMQPKVVTSIQGRKGDKGFNLLLMLMALSRLSLGGDSVRLWNNFTVESLDSRQSFCSEKEERQNGSANSQKRWGKLHRLSS